MVRQFSLFAVLAVVSVAQAKNTLVEAAAGEFPSAVSVRVNGIHRCGGAIITFRHIVTTAKCVSAISKKDDVIVITGSLSSRNGGDIYTPREIFIHPRFRPGSIVPNDIAIIALKRKINLKVTQRQLYLPWEYTPNGTDATLMGWRWAPVGDPSDSEFLMKLTVKIKKCSDSDLAGFKDICASVVSGSDKCLPDNGGPLVITGTHSSNGKLIGLLSHGNPCDAGTSAIFTNVFYYMGWIFQTVRAS